ncbi:DUF3221 domain-containing protein [Metabacillus malikii]|uniref:DUF3221 domain-containing protein n=1 Tax=Metabacillus malikii TaxID=1504265 RepID=A0ABT9ZLK1_9BACI|nr:DUF3221 domain-containing protein [Metabacillus malikii]MDQ0232672.1 hypothetical protein [Metabacillus malikii]
MKKILFITLMVIISSSLVACGKEDMRGIILEVTENEVLLSKNLPQEKYEEIKDKSISQILDEEKGMPLISLDVKKTDEWSKGDEVRVWIDGNILASYPEQAKATKIETLND